MSKALSACHGHFGRAAVYQLNRPSNCHAHREGHLIFHVGGADGFIEVGCRRHVLSEHTVVAINPWEPHTFIPGDTGTGGVYFLLYINADWLAQRSGTGEGLQFGATCFGRTPGLNKVVRRVAALVCGAPTLHGLDGELRQVIDACYLESEGQAEEPGLASPQRIADFRIRKSIQVLCDRVGDDVELDSVARASCLSRPHFYRLFRQNTGVTPNVYRNTLLVERALDALVSTVTPVSDICFGLGFNSQSSFTRFFAANVGMAPTDYRRRAQIFSESA